VLGALALVCLLLLGAAGYLAYRFKAAPEDHLAQVVPQDAVFYANVFIRPSTSQAKDLGHLVAKVVETDAGEEISEGLQDVVDPCGANFDTLRELGGTQIALFVMADGSVACALDAAVPDGAALNSQATDEVRGAFVFGDVAAVRAASSTTERNSLASDPDHQSAIAASEPDRLAFIQRASSFERSPRDLGSLYAVDKIFSTVQHLVVRVEEDRLVLEGSVGSDGAELWQEPPAPIAAGAPRDAWFVLSLRNLSGWLDALTSHADRFTSSPVGSREELFGLSRERLWGWSDAARLWVAGEGLDIGAGAEVVADSSTLADRAAADVLRLKSQVDSPFLKGFVSGMLVGAAKDVLTVRVGDEREGTLADHERFIEAEAWLDQPETSLYLDIAAAKAASSLLPLDQEMRALLSHLDRLIIGGGQGGDNFTWRAVLGVK